MTLFFTILLVTFIVSTIVLYKFYDYEGELATSTLLGLVTTIVVAFICVVLECISPVQENQEGTIVAFTSLTEKIAYVRLGDQKVIEAKYTPDAYFNNRIVVNNKIIVSHVTGRLFGSEFEWKIK